MHAGGHRFDSDILHEFSLLAKNKEFFDILKEKKTQEKTTEVYFTLSEEYQKQLYSSKRAIE